MTTTAADAGDRFWELKESAKWSLDVSERKNAIKQLAEYYGQDAIQSIAEIRDVAAYDEIRQACADAIKAAASTTTAQYQQHETPEKIKRHSARKAKAKKSRRKTKRHGAS
jgi:hypothetical protein